MGFESSAFGLGNTSEEVRNPITAFNFVLEVEGVYFLPLKSVRAFTKENEYEYIKEGGVNDYVHMKRKPISKPFTFQIERYVGTERFLDPLANGTELILPLILHVYRHAAMRGFTALPDASPARLYTFTGCTVISKEYGELNSERSGILTEVTTIAYRELMVVTNCFTSTEKDRWFMNGGTVNGEKIGNKKVKFATQANNDKLDIYTKNKLGFTVRADDAAINMPPWDGSMGRQTKYAKDSAFDGDNTPYKMVDVGDLFTWVKRAGVPLNKPAWTGENGAVVAHATEQLGDKGDGYPYERGDVGDVKNTWIMKDKMSFKKPAYEFRVDQDKLKYAQKALVDKNATDPIYKKNEDGSLVRADNEKINKPAWTGKEGAKTYAAQAAPDKADDTYMYGADGELIRIDNKSYNKGPWNGEHGSEPIWATQANPDVSGETYSVGEDGKLTRTDKVPYNKPAWTGKKGSNNQWATPQANDLADNSNYTKGDVGDIKNTLIMKEGKSFAKPQYQMKSDMNTLKYAQMATIDKNAGDKIYAKGEDGYTVRSDNAEINKPAWTGKEGSKSYATKANPDTANDTYMYGADGEFMRVDNKPYNKAPWNGEYGSIPIWATMAKPDMEGGAYSRGEDGYLSRIDKASYNKKPWTGEKGSNTSHAKSQPNDKDESRPYTKGDVGDVKNTWIMKEGSSFAKPQYQMKNDMNTLKYAQMAYLDKLAGNKIYKQGEDGFTVRADNAKINKPAWSGKDGAKRYSTQAAPDEAGASYAKGEDGNLVRKDNAPYNKGAWKGEFGSIPIWATPAKPDLSQGNYITGEDGHLVRNDDAPYNKPAWSGKDGAKRYSTQAAPDEAGASYAKGEDGYLVRKDNAPYNKGAWKGEFGSIPIWATPAKPDLSQGNYITGEDGFTVRNDDAPYNKPAWSGKEGAKRYSKQALPDESGTSYSRGEGGNLVRNDDKPYNKPAWSGKEGAKRYSTQAAPDEEGTSYGKGEDGNLVRKDGAPYNKPAWSGKEGAKRYSKQAAPDEAGKSYSKGENGNTVRTDGVPYNKAPWTGAKGTTNQWAKPQTSTASTPPKAQYELKKDGTNNKWAKVSTKDKEKPKLMPQYELKKNMTQNLYATVSPTDGDRAPQVIWPPTRRALMADTLSKK